MVRGSRRVGVLLAAIAIACGCAPAPLPPSPPPAAAPLDPARIVGHGATSRAHGIVSAGAPVIGATVRAERLDGTPLGTAVLSQASGAYVLPLLDLPADFRLVATGGMVDGQAFADELRAEVRGFHAEYGPIDLGRQAPAAPPRRELNQLMLAAALIGTVYGHQAGVGLGMLLGAVGVQSNDEKALAALKDLDNQVEAIRSELQSTTNDLLASIATSAYDTSLLPMLQYRARNAYVRDEIAFISALGKDNAADRDYLRGKLTAYIATNYKTAEADWHTALMGGPFSDGAIANWQDYVKAQQPRFFTIKNAKRIQAWWDTWDAEQSIAVAIKIEGLRANEASATASDDVKATLRAWSKNRAKQLAALKVSLRPASDYQVDLSGAGVTPDPIVVNTLAWKASGDWAVEYNGGADGKTPLLWLTGFATSMYTKFTFGIWSDGGRGTSTYPGNHDMYWPGTFAADQAEAERRTGVAASTWAAANCGELVHLFGDPADGPRIERYGFNPTSFSGWKGDLGFGFDPAHAVNLVTFGLDTAADVASLPAGVSIDNNYFWLDIASGLPQWRDRFNYSPKMPLWMVRRLDKADPRYW